MSTVEFSATCGTAARSTVAVTLGHSLQIKDVQAVHRSLLDALGSGSNVAVDVSGLAALDTAGVQLLLALRAETSKRGKSFELRGESQALTQALAALGLQNALMAKSGCDHL